MVDLCAAGHSRRSAATTVAADLYQKGGTEIEGISERLRKHYRQLESAGKLPKAATPIERKAEAVKESFRQHDAGTQEAQRQFTETQEQARSLGIDLNDSRTFAGLEEKQRELKWLLDASPLEQMVTLRRRGAETPEECAKRLVECDAELQLVERKLEILRQLRELSSRASWVV